MGLNRTGMHHTLPVAVFALRCLVADLIHHRNR